MRAPKAISPISRADGPRSAGYRAWLAALLRQKAHQAAFKRAITTDKHPHFIAATRHAAAYAEGLPVQPTVDLTPREPAHLTSVQLAEALPRLVGLLPGTVKGKAALLEALDADYEVVD